MNGLGRTARISFESYRVWLTALALNTPLIFGILMLNAAGDGFVFRIFKFHLNLFWIEFILADFGSLGLTSSTILSGMGMLAGVVAVEISILRLSEKSGKLRNAAGWFPVLAILMFGASQVVHIVAYRWNDDRITKVSPILPLYIPFQSHSEAPKLRAMLPWIGAEKGGSPEASGSGSIHYPLKNLEFSAVRVMLRMCAPGVSNPPGTSVARIWLSCAPAGDTPYRPYRYRTDDSRGVLRVHERFP